jgi:hypothetical protein
MTEARNYHRIGRMVCAMDHGDMILEFPWRMTLEEIEMAKGLCLSQLEAVAKYRRALSAKEEWWLKWREFAP